MSVYKKAHKGEGDTVVMQPREVIIYDFNTSSDALPLVSFEVKCSKGTYIRSLAFDFGKKIGTGAYLASLRRTASGEFTVDDAWQLDDLIRYIDRYEPSVVVRT